MRPRPRGVGYWKGQLESTRFDPQSVSQHSSCSPPPEHLDPFAHPCLLPAPRRRAQPEHLISTTPAGRIHGAGGRVSRRARRAVLGLDPPRSSYRGAMGHLYSNARSALAFPPLSGREEMRRSRSSARAASVAQERRALLLLGLGTVALLRGVAAGGCDMALGATGIKINAGNEYMCAILVRLGRGGVRRGGGNALL